MKINKICKSGHQYPYPYPWLDHMNDGIDYVEFQEPPDKGEWRNYDYNSWRMHCDDKIINHNPSKLISSHIKSFINKRTRFAKILYHFNDGTVREPTAEDYMLESKWFEKTTFNDGKDYDPHVDKKYKNNIDDMFINVKENLNKKLNKNIFIISGNLDNKSNIEVMAKQMVSTTIRFNSRLQKNKKNYQSFYKAISRDLEKYKKQINKPTKTGFGSCNSCNDIQGGICIYDWCCHGNIECKYII